MTVECFNSGGEGNFRLKYDCHSGEGEKNEVLIVFDGVKILQYKTTAIWYSFSELLVLVDCKSALYVTHIPAISMILGLILELCYY